MFLGSPKNVHFFWGKQEALENIVVFDLGSNQRISNQRISQAKLCGRQRWDRILMALTMVSKVHSRGWNNFSAGPQTEILMETKSTVHTIATSGSSFHLCF